MDWICLMNSSPILALSWNNFIQPLNTKPTFPARQQCFIFLHLRYSAKLALRTMQVHFPDGLRNASSAYQTNLTETREFFFPLFFYTAFENTAVHVCTDGFYLPQPFMTFQTKRSVFLFIISVKPQDVLAHSSKRRSPDKLWLLIFAAVCWLHLAFLYISKKIKKFE